MKYFYTDLRAAQWMHVKFSMSFICDAEFPETDSDIYKYRNIGLYIHPDSLHLLEPQVSDVIQFGDDSNLIDGKQVVIITADEGPQSNVAVYEQGLPISHIKENMETDPSFKIIQRNGVAFMWPESEE